MRNDMAGVTVGRFDEGVAVQKQAAGQAGNPAAPEGARQMAAGGRFGSGLQQWQEPEYADKATSWFTGQNREGTNNGWSNEFVTAFQSGFNSALEQGTARSYFDTGRNPEATGVVSWDHTTDDGTVQSFGDVYEKGKKVGNLYQMYDREVADMMMAPWVLDNDAQASAFSSSDWKFGLKSEIEREHAKRNETFESSLKQLEFQGDVDKREAAFEKFAGGYGDEALIGGAGAAGGAALAGGLVTAGGALAGTGVGAVPGAVVAGVGGLVGGAAALLNQDAITEQAARAYEISKMSFEQNNFLAGSFTMLGQTAGVAGKFIAPTSNLVQGLYDWRAGDIGDGESAFYRTDKEGGNAAPTWMRALDVGATVVDSLAQFSSGVGIAAYTAQMSGTIGGEVGELAFSGGKTFDYRTAGFDNIFTDEDGNFDASAAAAGIAKIGIDAVQLGMARGLANKTSAMRANVAGETAPRGLIGRRLDQWRGGTLGAGERQVEQAGFRFVQKADGTIDATKGSRIGKFLTGTEGARPTLGILAPSEQLGFLSARVMGLRTAARRPGGAATYTADDFYRSAQSLAMGERRFTSALVNGFGEGYEEAVQAVLEPHSHGGTVDGGELASAFFYGTAAGVGMGLGTSMGQPSADQQMFALANMVSMKTSGTELKYSEWKDLSETQKRGMASLSSVEQEVLRTAYEQFAKGQATQQVAGVAGLAKLHDAIVAKTNSDLARATNRTDGAFVITQLENTPKLDETGNLLAGEIGMDAVAASAAQTAQNLRNVLRGVEAGLTGMQRELEKAKARTADPGDADAQVRVDALTAQIELADTTLRMGRLLGLAVEDKVDAMTRAMKEGTFADLQAEVDVTNALLRQAFNKELDFLGGDLSESDKVGLQRAASMLMARDPHDSAGSYQVLVPQISARLTETASHNVLEVSHAILTPLRGDYDGDKLRNLAQLLLDETEYTSARAGMHYVGAGESVAVGVPKYEKFLMQALTDSLTNSTNVALSTTAENVLVEISRSIRNRYSAIIEASVLDKVITDFHEQVRTGNVKARQTLLDGLAAEAGSQITAFARDNHSNEWLWLDQLLVSHLQRFQEAYASHRPDLDVSPNVDTGVAPIQQQLNVRKRLAERAATLGQTLGILSPGDSMFRKFQKLHYSSKGAGVQSATGESGGMDLQDQADLYRELSQRVTASELQRLGAMDDIVGAVYVQLEALAKDFVRENKKINSTEALVIVANLQVQDFDFAEDGSIVDKNYGISLAQMLLKQAVIRDQREKARIVDFSPELQAKHAKLLKMTKPSSNKGTQAQAAFIEIVGSQQFYTLLGDDAMIFGPHQTVEQFVRYYTSLSTPARQRLYRDDLRGEPAYLGSKRHPQTFPANLKDLVDSNGEATTSAYRFMVDAIVAAGNSRISMDAEGGLEGEMVDRSDLVRDNIRASHSSVRKALREFTDTDALGVEKVEQLLDHNRELARAVMDLIPNASAAAAFQVREDGEVLVANWVYQMFAMDDPAEAEMHYWRNLLITEWNAMGMPNHLSEEGEDGEAVREFHRLPRRMHRVMYKLAKADDGGVRYQRFITEMMRATNLEEFMVFVNTFPGIKGEQAPIVAWVDDVAEFDADKAKGGWTTALQGAELREAIGVLRQRTENLAEQLVEERTTLAKDARTIQAIRRSWSGEGTEEDNRLAANFEKAVKDAGEWQQSVGPQVMLQQTVGALRGFYAQAHTKGKNPANVAAPGTFEAVRDSAFGFVTNYERMLASLTSANINDVSANFSELAKDGMRITDDQGRQIEWTQPTPQQLLDMMSTKETRPLARAILFPQVTEVGPTGQIGQRLLIGKSLTDLVNGTSYKDLFPKAERLSAEAALRYGSMVEGVARKYGGSFALQRAVNDLVLARTSMTDHVLSEYELEQMTTRAYYEVAEVLQAVGGKMLEVTDDGTPALRGLLDQVKQAQRRIRTGRALGMTELESDQITDGVLDLMIQAKKDEHKASILELAKKAERDPSNVHIYEQQADADERAHKRFLEHIKLIRTDDYVGQVVDMFSIAGDTTEQAAKKDALLDFVRMRMDMIQRVSSIKDLMAKISSQMLDTSRQGQVDLTDAEWETLSRAIIGLYLDDAARTSAAGVSVSPWPDAEHPTDARYFDTSWGYLVESLLDPESALAQAARDVHLMAGRLGADPMLDSEVVNLLGRTVLDHNRLGPWTADIPRASMEANSRLDSSSAEAAIAGVGNSPKRQAAMIAASRRTTLDPLGTDWSTSTISWFDINRPQFDEVDYVDVNGTTKRMALGQFNGRFVNSVTIVLPDGTEVDALRMIPDTSRAFTGDDTVRHSGLGTVTVARLQRAFSRVAERTGTKVEALQVKVSFLHPDSMPAEGEYANNIYYEGTSFELDADRHESLLATLWLANESISPAGQAQALDASKLGRSAFQVIDTATVQERQAAEANWETDFAAMLRAKTASLLETDLGFGELDPQFYNAVYKDMKLRHFVRGTVDGKPVLLRAEDVLQAQRLGEPLPDNAALWVPSDDALRTLLGEQGNQGVARMLPGQLEINPALIPTFRGVTEEMARLFEAGIMGEPATLETSRLVHEARKTVLSVRVQLDDKQRNAYDARMKFLDGMKTDIHEHRASPGAQVDSDKDYGFNAKRNLDNAVRRGSQMLTAEDLSLHWTRMGIPFGPRSVEENILSTMMLRDLRAAAASDGQRTGWIYREGSAGSPALGLLSQHSLDGTKERAYHVAPKDLVVVELDSFGDNLDLAKKRMKWFADRGAIIMLGAGDGSSDLRAELGVYMEELGYTHIVGSTHGYKPAEYGSRFQNQRARTSTLMATEGMSARNRLAIFNVQGLAIHENAAWANLYNPDGSPNARMKSVAATTNLVPTSAMAGLNVPATDMQIDDVRRRLQAMDNKEGRAFLKQLARGGKKADPKREADFDAAFDRLMQRFDNYPGRILPQQGDDFGLGDIIPLVDNTGQILLYRHGHKAIDRDVVRNQMGMMRPGTMDAAGFAVFSHDHEPAATIHEGKVVQFRQRPSFGLEVEMDMPLQVYGDKKQLEWNGMKYVLAPMTSDIELPSHGFFANWGIDIVSDLDSLLSKEAVGDMVDNHRTAFAVFGMDFLPDVTEVFFPGKGSSADAQRMTREILNQISRRKTDALSVEQADELLKSRSFAGQIAAMLPSLPYSDQIDRGWLLRLADQSSVSNQITSAIVTYLMVSGTKVEDVLSSGGFNSEVIHESQQSRLMPYIFTQIFDMAPLGSPLRKEINRRLNAQITNPRGRGTGYTLREDFQMVVDAGTPGKKLVGFLQFAEAHSSGDNPIRNGMAFDETQRAAVSAHSAAVAYGAIGAETPLVHDIARARAFANAQGVTRFNDGVDGGAWRMLTHVPKEDKAFENWRMQTPAEMMRRDNARDAMLAFRVPIDQAKEYGWNDKQRAEYAKAVKKIVETLHLRSTQGEVVDYWVRQTLGQPHGEAEDGRELGRVTGKGALEAADDILKNVQAGYIPTLGAEVPALHLHDLQAIYRANKTHAMPWAPRSSMGGDATRAKNWNAWVETSLGSMLTSDNLFDPLYLLALDGHMHSYQHAVGSLMDLPVSMSSLVNQSLLNEDMMDMVASLNEDANVLAKNPALIETIRSDLDKLLGGDRIISGKFKHRAAPASEVAKRRDARRRWRKENGVPLPVDVSMRNFRKNGAQFVDEGTNSNALVRIVMNIRVGTALINPQLYVSMGPEQWIRGALDQATNILTGDATTRVGGLAPGGYDGQEAKALRELYAELGDRSDFKKMVYGDLAYKRPHGEHGPGRVEGWSEAYAKLGSRVQDPTWGVRATTLARRYVESALKEFRADPLGNTMTSKQLRAELRNNPHFLKDNHPELHQIVSNRVADLRSLKQTTLNRMLRGVIDPAINSDNAVINTAAGLTLKPAFAFSTYLTNVLTTITGAQGADQVIAMFLEGRENPKNTLIGRAQAAMRGEEFTPEDDANFDMGSVIDGINLSQAFIRGGLTHSALFLLGAAAGGLGLSGEDDEMRKRRRLAEAQGVGILYNPLDRLENSFINADAIYLDWLPAGIGDWLTGGGEGEEGAGRAMGHLHWMMRQFISPIIGFEKYFETGDVRHIKWGFEDAIGSFPLINTMMWHQASETFDMMADKAAGKEVEGDAPGQLGFLLQGVATYERMLFENAFVNQLYVAFDDWDRDPYKLPLRDSDGDLQKDAEGNTRENNLALSPFLAENDEGKLEVQTGYLNQNTRQTTLKVLTENRAVLAGAFALFSGKGADSQYLRYNMPIKTREIEKPTVSKDETEAVIRKISQSLGGQQFLTDDELAQIWKNQAAKAGKWVNWGEVDEAATTYLERLRLGLPVDMSMAPANPLAPAPMSVLDAKGNEVLTRDGARAVFRGMANRAVELNDPQLRALAVPYEMRQEIANEWATELVQEGVDLGLDKVKATSRMKRIMYGPYGTDVLGIADLLFLKPEDGGISYQTKQVYGQQNTTYVMGPGGVPWATGIKRDVWGALGMKPVEGLIRPTGNATKMDNAGNTVDLVNGMNTGLRALVPFDDTRNIPTDVEIGKAIEKAIEDAAQKDYTPFTKTASKDGGGGYGGYGYRRYRRGGYGGYGGGGGGGGAYFQKMYSLPDGFVPYANDISFINTNTPSPRRAFVRRERVESSRGRLMQWQ